MASFFPRQCSLHCAKFLCRQHYSTLTKDGGSSSSSSSSSNNAAGTTKMPIPPPLPPSRNQADSQKRMKAPPMVNAPDHLNVESQLDEVQKKLQRIATLPQEEFDRRFEEFTQREKKSNTTAIRDDIFQMSISDQSNTSRKVKVFYKDVDIACTDGNWWTVTLDGRKVKALESKQTLYLPNEEMAVVVAHEWAQQKDYINKLLMPMNDIASGSQLVDQDGIDARLLHLLTFLRSDNLFYRHSQLKNEEEKLCEPVCKWFDSFFDVVTPRVEGIQHASVAESTRHKVHEGLQALNMNKYQIVSLYVIAQYTASIVLACAVVFGAVDLDTALQINRLEEMHNVDSSIPIDGYHDLRDADLTIKVAACASCWNMTKNLSASETVLPAKILQQLGKEQ